ncbi:MAG: hypothetical protein HY908_23910 [Myxococcales bacterium]|nr:hypothetical protein [Myxococcales bacterium]
MNTTKGFRLRFVALCTATTAWLVGTAACGSVAKDWCEKKCNCEGCSDRAHELCELEIEAEIDVADAYDCSPEREDYDDCALRQGDCDQNDWRLRNDVCVSERQALADCISAASDLDNHVVNPPVQCACQCTCATCGPIAANPTCPPDPVCTTCNAVCTTACATTANCGAFVSSTGTCQ